MEGLLRISLVILGFGQEFGCVVDHNYINLFTVPITKDLLQGLSKRTGATKKELEMWIKKRRNKA